MNTPEASARNTPASFSNMHVPEGAPPSVLKLTCPLACCLCVCVPESAARRVMEHALLNDESEYGETNDEVVSDPCLIPQADDSWRGSAALDSFTDVRLNPA